MIVLIQSQEELRSNLKLETLPAGDDFKQKYANFYNFHQFFYWCYKKKLYILGLVVIKNVYPKLFRLDATINADW